MSNNDPNYIPEIPGWVAKILTRKQQQDPFATLGNAKRWEFWKRKYSRKLKYARLNGWTIKEDED